MTPVLPTPSGPISGSPAFISPGEPCFTATSTPGERSVWPETTTLAPACSPLPIGSGRGFGHRYRLRRDRRIALDRVNERSLRAHLYRRRRNRDAVF